MINDNIINWFELLIKQLEFYVDVKTGKDKLIYSYKLSSIKKALKVIKGIGHEIKKGSELKNLENIGKGTIDRIDEIIKTGKLKEVNDADISGKHLEYVEELMKIFGIGRSTAYELYTKHGIKSIQDLKTAIRTKSVELPETILKGISYVDKIDTKIPRSEMDQIYEYLIQSCIKLDNNMDVRVCGSYRREKDVSGDIDVIISHPDIITKKQAKKSDLLTRFIKNLLMEGFIIDSFTSENVPTKYMGVCRYKNTYPLRRIDVRFFAQESYYCALLYFTGSDEFNKKMRRVALSMGYTLNEYFLLNEKRKPFVINSEQDVFNLLNMEYLVPKERV